MRYILSLALIFLVSLAGIGQSATTQELHKKYEDAFYLFFYKNTLKMINKTDDKDFAELIERIEKMKFIRLEKEKVNFTRDDVRNLIAQYQEEEFEELMTMREENSDIKIFIKEKDKITSGLVMLINNKENLAILDIKGSVPMNQLVALYDKVKEIN